MAVSLPQSAAGRHGRAPQRGWAGLGALYANGRGVAQDYGQAAALYQKACEGGVEPACELLRERGR